MPPSNAETNVDEKGENASERESLLHPLSPWPSQPALYKADATFSMVTDQERSNKYSMPNTQCILPGRTSRLFGRLGGRRRPCIFLLLLVFLLAVIASIIATVFSYARVRDQPPDSAQRVHFISAEYVQWNFTDGDNKCYVNGIGGPGPSNTPGSNLSTISGSFRKAIFRAYSNEHFNTPLDRDPKWQVSIMRESGGL